MALYANKAITQIPITIVILNPALYPSNKRLTCKGGKRANIILFTATLQPKWTTPDKQKSDGILQWRNAILPIAVLF